MRTSSCKDCTSAGFYMSWGPEMKIKTSMSIDILRIVNSSQLLLSTITVIQFFLELISHSASASANQKQYKRKK